MEIDLAADLRNQQFLAILENRYRRLITRTLNRQNQCSVKHEMADRLCSKWTADKARGKCIPVPPLRNN
jgi:transposase